MTIKIPAPIALALAFVVPGPWERGQQGATDTSDGEH
jgi:hypothetical protein